MRILINGDPPEGVDNQKIKMGIISKLLAANLTGEEVTEIVTTNKNSDFAEALNDFCDGANIAYRVVSDVLSESIDVQLYVTEF